MNRFANYDKFIMDCFNCMEIANATTEPRNWNEADAEVSHDIGQYKRWTNSPLEIIAQFELHRGARATQLNVQF